MRKRIPKHHILLLVSLFTVFLISVNSVLSACASLPNKSGDVRCNSVSAWSSRGVKCVGANVLEGKIFYISEAFFYTSGTSAVFSAECSGNALNSTSTSFGSYLNGIFKKLKRLLLGISKLF
jgi:hypothetical protein